MACIWRFFLWFFIQFCCLCGCHYGLFLLLFACLHIVINHSTICIILVSFPCITMGFCYCNCLVLCGTKSALLASAIVIPFTHNIATSLYCCNVDHFIHVVAILRYDYKHALNIIVVGICKPWANFWIHS